MNIYSFIILLVPATGPRHNRAPRKFAARGWSFVSFSRKRADGKPENAGFRKRGGRDLPFHAVLREQDAKSALRIFS